MVWLFVDPTPLAHSPEIAKGLEEFAVVSQALNPTYTPELAIHAMNNESLAFAEKLVKGGFAVWKPGWDMEKLRQTLHDWQTAINASRMEKILGKEQQERKLV
jgi:hypothetical protein